MKSLIIIILVLIVGISIADDAIFVHDSMFVYYSELGDKLLEEFRADTDLLDKWNKCLNAYFNAIEALKQSKSHTSLQTAKVNFQLASALVETDTLAHGKPYVPNWKLAKRYFSSGKFSLSLRLIVIANRKHDKKKWAAIVESFEPYFKSYIWLLEAGGDPYKAKEIKQDFERYRLLFK